MRFFRVHEIEPVGQAWGRMRLRSSEAMSVCGAEAVQKAMAGLANIRDVRVNPLVGSVLFFYADAQARIDALTMLVDLAKNNIPCQEPAPGDTRRPVEQASVAGFMPLLRYIFIRPLLPPWIRIAMAVVGSVPFLVKGITALARGKLSVEVLDAAAITASLLLKDFPTVSTLTLLLGLGETIEEMTRQSSLASLADSLATHIETVWVLRNGCEVSVPIAQVHEGDAVVVLAGSSIPVDGTVIEGEGLVNQASMTGEPLGVQRSQGESVFAGTVLEEGRIVVSAQHVGESTRLQQVVKFIEESEVLKAGIQGKFERMADYAVPVTFLLAIVVYCVTRNFRRAASVLLVDYSCALKLATPLAVLSAMREAAHHGLVIKGGRYLEALQEADTLVMDKTGTLTQANPVVGEVFPAPGYKREDVLRMMACLEEHFPHPVARAVVHRAEEEKLQHAEKHAHAQYVVAHGVTAMQNGKKLCVGSRHFVEQDEGVDLSPLDAEIRQESERGRSLLFLSEDNCAAGLVSIEDPVRPESARVIAAMRDLGIHRIVMLTGDDARTAKAVATRLGIDEFRAQVLPQDKATVVQELTDQGCKVMMVGDGINDAPALSCAHVGVAMSDGTDLAREVANVQLTNPSLESLVAARILGQRTLATIHHNFVITMVANTLFLAGGLAMILSPGLSALLHNMTTLAVSLNAMRPHLGSGDHGAISLS
ncbi:MAG: heavy metal translocating P-type ATPase [Desulfovibrio sp.]|nr:heavy metal translocating P-type ATPase [Desulfovibrio sp.]